MCLSASPSKLNTMLGALSRMTCMSPGPSSHLPLVESNCADAAEMSTVG